MEKEDLIYKIGGFMLYDNQLDYEYLILFNRVPTKNKDCLTPDGGYYDDVDYDFNTSLPYPIGGPFSWSVLNKIYNLPEEGKKEKSVEIMEQALKDNGLVFIKLTNDFHLVKGKTHNQNYSSYDFYYNEAISGINIMEYDLAATWKAGDSTYSTIRLHEFKNRREEALQIKGLKWSLNYE